MRKLLSQTDKNKQFKEIKTMKSYLYLIRQSCCKSGIAIFAWKVTWN